MSARCLLFLSVALVVALSAPRAASQDISLRSPLFEEIAATPGETYERTLEIENLGDREQRIRLFQLDYTSDLDGRSYYSAPEDSANARSNARWVALPRTSIVVPADTTIRLPYSVAIPAGFAGVGTHWSVVMVEPDGDPSAVSADVGNVQVSVQNRFRYAVHIATTLGTGTPSVAIDTPRLVDDELVRALRVDIRNQGDVIARPNVWLEAYGPSGEFAGRFESVPRPLYPSTVRSASIDLASLPGGTYSALLYIDDGGPDLTGARLTLDLSDPSLPPAEEAAEDAPNDTPAP